jgi:GNAT superfamily N-acetyltransferase
MTTARDIAATIRATWPPERLDRVGPFDVAWGAGGGNRVSAARLTDPASDGAMATTADIEAVERTQIAGGQAPLFAVFAGQEALDRTLEDLAYRKRDETLALSAPVADLAEPPPPVSCFDIWPPLAVQEEIWQTGGIGPARLAIMHRADGPKTCLFGRIDDRPAATAFIALHGRTAMLHALEVLPQARRKGLARLMMRAGAAWARDQGATQFTVLVTRTNDAAGRLYASLGLKPVGHYHYRAK